MAEILIRMKKMMEDFNQSVKILEEENKKKKLLKKSSQNYIKYVRQYRSKHSKDSNTLFNRPLTSKQEIGVNHQFNLIPIIKSTSFLTEAITKKQEKKFSKRKSSHSTIKRPMTGNSK